MSAEPSGQHVVITMPAYRAVKTLERTVRAIPEGVVDELILVDDASLDGTAELGRGLGLRVYVHTVNRGYGGNQKTCYTQALRHGATIIVMLHPDYQYEPEAVPLLIAPILAERADVTFGSRFAGLGDPRAGGMPLYRYIGNRLTTVLENLMLGARFTETHSGMRAYTREALLSLPFLRYSDDFVFDSQLLVDAVTSGLRVVEVPIPTRYTEESSSVAIGQSIRYVLDTLLYCAEQTRERGRRGARSPVARMRKRSVVAQAVPGLTSAPLDRLAQPLDGDHEPNPAFWTRLPLEARGYAVRGTRLAVLGGLDLGNRAVEERASDVVIFPSRDGALDSVGLERAARIIDAEGLLVILLHHSVSVRALYRAVAPVVPLLEAAGFRPVEVRRGMGCQLSLSRRAALIARPLSA